jgi:hypothetical protein
MANIYPDQVPFDPCGYLVEGYAPTERVKTLRNSLPTRLQLGCRNDSQSYKTS